MSLSPLCQVQVNSGPFVSPANGVNASSGNTISIQLVSTTSVTQWYLQCVGFDETSTAPTPTNVNPSTFLVTSPSTIPTFVLPGGDGQSYILQSTVLGPGGPLVTTFGIFVLTANGDRVGSVGETREGSSAFGWITKLNPILREGAGYLYYNDTLISPTIGASTIQAALDHVKSTPSITLEVSSPITVSGPSTTPTIGFGLPGQTQGDITYFNGTNWVRLPAGTSGQVLETLGVADPQWVTIPLPSDFNLAGQTQGDTLYFNGTAWVRLPAGTSGQFLETLGTGANPGWAVVVPSDLNIAGQTLGDLLYYNGTHWVRLPAGTSGQFLETLGVGFAPTWATVGGGGGGISQITGGVVAGPGSGSVNGNVVALTKTVDCTDAGIATSASITSFDGTYVTVTGMGPVGAVLESGSSDISAANLYGPALSGSGAATTAFVTPLSTITGLTGMYPSIVGKTITFSGSGNAGNNGSFVIADYVSATSVKITNTSAVPSDAGPLTWSVSVGLFDGLTLSLIVDSQVLGTIANVTNYEGLFEIQTAAPNSLTTGNTVAISGSTNTDSNGLWTITVIDSTHFTLNGAAFSGTYTGGGLVTTGALTLTLNAATNALSEAAFLAAIGSHWPTIVATQGGFYGLGLTLTGTTLGRQGYISVSSRSPSTANTYINIRGEAIGVDGINVSGQMPTALTLSSFAYQGNNGTFNVHSWVDSSTVTVVNTLGVAPDLGLSAFVNCTVDMLPGTLYGPLLSNVTFSGGVFTGSVASVSAFTSPVATITGLTHMSPGLVGSTLHISGAASGGNNGGFVIAEYISQTSVQVYNASAVAGDANNGALGWTITYNPASISAFATPLATVTGLFGMSPGIAGSTLTLSGSSHGGNNGTFPIAAYVSPTSVQINNSSAVSPDSGPLNWSVGVAVAGFSTPLSLITGLTGITTSSPGQSITFTGFANSGNNGTFVIAGYVNENSATVINTSAVSTDTGSTWSIPDGTLDGQTVILNVNSGGPTELTLDTSTNAISRDTLFAAIETIWPSLSVSLNDFPSTATMRLNDSTTGPTSSIVPVSSITGTLATLTAGTFPNINVLGLTGITPGIAGATIVISGSSNAVNNGSFIVAAYVSATSISITNASAITPDSGPLTWSVVGNANTALGILESGTGYTGVGTFAVSLTAGLPPLSGTAVVKLTGNPYGWYNLCTQGAGTFRIQVENTTATGGPATFASTNNPVVGNGDYIAVSSDGTLVTYETAPGSSPVDYSVQGISQDISGGSGSLAVSPNTPFTYTLVGTPSDIATVSIINYLPFYSLVVNDTLQPIIVSNNVAPVADWFVYAGVNLPKILRPGVPELVVSNGVNNMWSISSITADTGRAKRFEQYATRRANTGANAVNIKSNTLNGGDVIWGTSIKGGPYTQGTSAPFIDGTFSIPLTDCVYATPPPIGLPPAAPFGADIAVLGNILYMGGYNLSSSPVVTAVSVGTGVALASLTIPDATFLPNTLIAFKEASDPSSGIAVGGPSDCVFIVTNQTVGTWGLTTSSLGTGFAFEPNTSISGSWYGGRGVMLFGNDAASSFAGYTAYSSIGIWTDPGGGTIYAADVVNGQIGQTIIYNGGGNPQAICIDRESDSFWAVFGTGFGVALFSVNMQVGQNLTTTMVSRFGYPYTVETFDDILFDGAYLWAIEIASNTYYQLTPNGLVVTSYNLSNDASVISGTHLSLTTGSRLYSDGSHIYLTGLLQQTTACIAKINPGTGQPVEYLGVQTGAARGLAFRGSDTYVATGPQINLASSFGDVPSGEEGIISTGSGGVAQFTDFSANWSPSNVGQYIIINGGADNRNNGVFQIVTWTASNQVGVGNWNATGSDESNNGTLLWQMCLSNCGIQRMFSDPPSTDFGTLDSIIQTPAVPGWLAGARIGARVVEYTNYSGSPHTFNISVVPLPGTRLLFIDRDGLAGLYPLTIAIDTSYATINGQTSYTIQTNYGYVELEYDGSQWLVVGGPVQQGFGYITVSDGTNIVPAPQNQATMLVLTDGGLSADFGVQNNFPPAAGVLLFVRNTTGFNCNFSWGTGSSASIPTGMGAVVTSDGTNAVIMMLGT